MHCVTSLIFFLSFLSRGGPRRRRRRVSMLPVVRLYHPAVWTSPIHRSVIAHPSIRHRPSVDPSSPIRRSVITHPSIRHRPSVDPSSRGHATVTRRSLIRGTGMADHLCCAFAHLHITPDLQHTPPTYGKWLEVSHGRFMCLFAFLFSLRKGRKEGMKEKKRERKTITYTF